MEIELDTITSRIDKFHEDKPNKPRPHLGVSQIGHHCDRKLWLSFRWAVIEKFPGRMLRLFRRGQNEENVVVNDLKDIGMVIRSTGKNQERVDFGSHVSGSIDGIITSGVPEAPDKVHLLEIKTHNQKSFDDLVKNGVEKSKPEHWAQCHGYMLGMEIDRALYVAVCKNTDDIYTERIHLEKKKATALIERAKRIALSDRMPVPLSTDRSWYQCKFCPAHDLCHVSKLTKEVNCRTCAHSTALENGTWTCEKYKSEIPTDFQYTGCDAHVLHPDLVPWKQGDGDRMTAVYIIDGKPVKNGEGGHNSRNMVKEGFDLAEPWLAVMGGEIIDFDEVRGK